MNKYIFIWCVFLLLFFYTAEGVKSYISSTNKIFERVKRCIYIIYLLTYALEVFVFTSFVHSKLCLLCHIFYGSIAVTHFCKKENKKNVYYVAFHSRRKSNNKACTAVHTTYYYYISLIFHDLQRVQNILQI